MSYGNHDYYMQQEMQRQNQQLQERVRQLESALKTTKEQKAVSKKFYKVIKDNPLWEVGAILELKNDQYHALDGVDMWDKCEELKDSWLGFRVVEKSPDFFEKVYPVNLLTKTVYKCKAEAQEIWNTIYKDAVEKE